MWVTWQTDATSAELLLQTHHCKNLHDQPQTTAYLQVKKTKNTDTPAVASSEASDDTAVLSGDDGAVEAVAPDPLAVDNFRLSPQVKAVLKKKGIGALFDIQAQTLSHVLDGKDLLGRARYSTTGEVVGGLYVVDFCTLRFWASG